MANMPSPKDLARQPTYLYEMMQRLGIEPGEGVVPRLSMAYMTAFHRCQTCDHHAYIADLERFVDEIDELLLQKADDDPLVGELKSRKVRLCDEIEWLRRKPSQQACHIDS
jgi:hypothetical protein